MRDDAIVVYGFRELVVWQRAMDLAVEVHRLSKRLPSDERFGLTLQMRQAAASISANIAEGRGRDHRGDYLRFLSIARGSLMELDNHIEFAVRLAYLARSDAALAFDLLSQVRRLLSGLTHSLRAPRKLTADS